MGHPSWSQGQAATLFAGAVVLVILLSGPNAPSATGRHVASAQGPNESVPVSPSASMSQCEYDSSTEASCDLQIRILHEAELTPAVRLRIHKVDAQKTLESIEVPYSMEGLYHARLSTGMYHVNLLGAGTESVAFPLLVCRGDNSRVYWQRDLRPARGRVEGQILGQHVRKAQGAELLLQPESSDAVFHVPVGEDGRFSIDLPAGRYQYAATAPDHAAQWGALRVEEKGAFSMSIRLDWRPLVRGRVNTSDGRPVEGAHVFLGPRFDPKTSANVVVTDAQGRFEMPAIAATGLWLSTWSANQYAIAPLPSLDVPKEGAEIALTLQPGREVNGWVQNSDGRPHAFGEVRFRIRSLGMSGKIKADGEGRFRLQGMPKDADVELWAEGNATGAWGAVVASAHQNRVLLTYQAPAYPIDG